MEITYGRTHEFSFEFNDSERELLVEILRTSPLFAKWNKRIEKIKNDPKNDGQVTYLMQIDSLRADLEFMKELKEALGNEK